MSRARVADRFERPLVWRIPLSPPARVIRVRGAWWGLLIRIRGERGKMLPIASLSQEATTRASRGLDTIRRGARISSSDRSVRNRSTSSSVSGGGSGGFDDDEFEGLEQRLSRAPTLREHLSQQLQVDLSDPRERLLGAQLIEALDDDGYLRTDLSELAEQLGCERHLGTRLTHRFALLEGQRLGQRQAACVDHVGDGANEADLLSGSA
jgi:hypothetical protein